MITCACSWSAITTWTRPGSSAPPSTARGAELAVHLVPDDGPLPALDGVDHVIVLGAAWSVYDEASIGDWIGDRAGLAAPGRPGRRARARHLLRRPGPVRGAGRRGHARAPARDRLDHRRDTGPRRDRARPVAGVPRGPVPAAAGRPHPGPQRGVRPGLRAPRQPRPFSFTPRSTAAQLKRWLDGGADATAAQQAGQDPVEFLAETTAREAAAAQRADRLVAAALRLARAQLAAR